MPTTSPINALVGRHDRVFAAPALLRDPVHHALSGLVKLVRRKIDRS
jgi:hypothetical protein